jgi:hypothetical protein
MIKINFFNQPTDLIIRDILIYLLIIITPMIIFDNITVFFNKGLKVNTDANELNYIIPISLGILTAILVLIRQRKLYNLLRDGFINGNYQSRKDIDIIALSKNYKNLQIKQTIFTIFNNAYKGKDKALVEKIDIIREIAHHYQQEEPFLNMPENIRYVLKNIKQKLDDNPESEYLISQLQNIFNKEKTKLKIQYYLTIFGFMVGVIGIFINI